MNDTVSGIAMNVLIHSNRSVSVVFIEQMKPSAHHIPTSLTYYSINVQYFKSRY